jgi:His-Xaa-Ser system radical SAM maturase HxsC
VLTTFADLHPTTRFEVLTNGRLFHDRDLATALLTGLPPRVWWMIPLYGHADFLHDYVVQTEGAFDQTIDGLLTLHEHGQSVQLRIVLIEPTLRILPELCTFIGKNLPFVRQVALMGCEPTGFALANRSVCEVNVLDWQESLTQAVQRLVRAGIPTALMNLPLCALPESLHPFAHRSISDWKRVYATACQGCRLQDDCCGLFASHKRGWEPAPLRAITEEATL